MPVCLGQVYDQPREDREDYKSDKSKTLIIYLVFYYLHSQNEHCHINVKSSANPSSRQKANKVSLRCRHLRP